MRVLCLLLCLSFTFLELSGQNILHNESFEESPGDGGVSFWQKRPATWQDQDVFRTGEASYRFDPGVNQYSFYNIEENTIELGREYTLSAWTKTHSHNANATSYWRYVNLPGAVQFSSVNLNNTQDTSWQYVEWNFYPISNSARLDIFWDSDEGQMYVDDIHMQLKEREITQVYSLPEPWRLNISDSDVCTIYMEHQDNSGAVVSNSSEWFEIENLDPDILVLTSDDMIQAEFGRAQAELIGTDKAGIGRIVVKSLGFTDTLWISNREKLHPNDFFHIGAMLFPGFSSESNNQYIQDWEEFGMNIIMPINGGTAGTTQIMQDIENNQSEIKVIAQTHFINAASETFYPHKDWAGAVAQAHEYTEVFAPYDTILYGYRLSDEPDNEFNHNNVAFHSNALYAADPARQAITIDAWAFHLTERNMRIRNNDFKLTYVYPFNANTPEGIYPFDYGGVDSEVGFDSLSRYDNKPWYHMVQSFTMELDPPIKRWPLDSEMKQQAYSAVSFGARGIYYFFYHDIFGHPQEIRGLIEGGVPVVRRPLWYAAQEINWNLVNNERVFLDGVRSYPSTYLTVNDDVLTTDFTIEGPDGRHVMLMNRNALDTLNITLEVLETEVEDVVNLFDSESEVLSFSNDFVSVRIAPGDAMLLQLVDETSSVKENNYSNLWSVFPNPAQDQLFLNHAFSETVQVEIFDVQGKRVYVKDIKERRSQINIQDLGDDVYVLKLSSDKFSDYRSIVVH